MKKVFEDTRSYHYAKDQMLKIYQRKQEGKDGFFDVKLNYPMQDGIFLTFHFFDELKNFFTIGILFYEKWLGLNIMFNQWEFMISIQPKAEGCPIEILTGNEEWADFVDVFRNFGPAVNKAFDNAVTNLCSEEEREGCEYCRHYDEKAVNALRDNLNKYMFQTGTEGEKND